VATAATFLNALTFNDTNHNNPRGLEFGIPVHDRDTSKPLHVMPTQTSFIQKATPSATSQREIGKSFEGAYTHANNWLNKIKTQALHHNPHGIQFPTYRGTEDSDVDDGSTGELEGFFDGKPVL